ncbi:MAG: DUF4910 domain-containing protein [Sulfolobales archaeon]|nr:DUF4910 domain-containing protein [Sulfolobales archaeon]MDW8082959.1 DUF4910 domain-containing protein [Sulfolobales archaeon]
MLSLTVLEVLSEYFSRAEVEHLAEELSRYHRIQGSPGLEEAGRFIRDVLTDWGLDVRVYDLPYDEESPPTSAPIVGWFVVDGYAELVKPRRRIISSLKHAWTAVVAHSPPGEFEGKICYAPTYSYIARCGDSVVLTSDWGFGTYVKAAEAGAKAIIVFRKNAPSSSYPYFGIFPTKPELNYLKIPALTTPREIAEEIIGSLEKGEEVIVKGYVKSGYRGEAYARVIEASAGDAQEEYHLIAHYCHPGATVNDNVSGSVGVLSAARSLSLAVRESRLSVKKSIKFVLVPEHHGTVRYLRVVLGEGRRVAGAINLDMIGEKQCKTKSVLNFVRPPIALLSRLETSTYVKTLSVLPKSASFSSPAEFPMVRFSVINYETGSDHDVYVSLGIPAVMINQWPDRYYHSSGDTLDKMSPRLVFSVGVAALSAILELDDTRVEPYFHMVYGLDTVRTSGLPLSARQYLYWRKSRELGIDAGIQSVEPPSGGILVKLALSGYLTSLYLRYRVGLKALDRIRELSDKFKYSMTTLAIAGVYLREGGKNSEKLRFEVSGELGVEVPREVFNEILSLAEEAGYIVRE